MDINKIGNSFQAKLTSTAKVEDDLQFKQIFDHGVQFFLADRLDQIVGHTSRGKLLVQGEIVDDAQSDHLRRWVAEFGQRL